MILALPIRLIVGFHVLALTLFLAGIGIDYPQQNRWLLVAYVITLEVGLVLGYRVGATFAPYGRSSINFKIPIIGLFAIALLFVPNILTYTGGASGDFLTFLMNPADAYSAAVERAQIGREERIGLIAVKTVASPFVVAVLPALGFAYFRYRRFGKSLAIAALLSFATSVFRGTDKEMFDVAILLSVAWLAARAHREYGRGRETLRLASKRSIAGVGVTAVSLLAIFGFRKSERMDGVDIACFRGTAVCQHIAAENSLLFGVDYLVRYLTQGFYGLSVALDADIQVSGTGVGHSRPMQYLFETLFGLASDPGVTDQLPALGWTDRGAWSTGFVWIANDVTLYGVPFVMFAFGLLLAMGWRQVCESPDVASLVATSYMFYTLIYMIGNLQVAQIGDVYTGFLLWAAIYLSKRVAASHRSESVVR